MKQTIGKSQFIDAFHHCGRGEQFSYEALCALFECLECYEEDAGEELELDVIALCCEWSEDSIEDIISNYAIELDNDLDDDDKSDTVYDFLCSNTQAVMLNNGCILYIQF